MHEACDKGHDKIVQLLLDHGFPVDTPDEVSELSCIHVVKLCNTTEITKATLITNECVKCMIYDRSNILAKTTC